MKTPVAFLIFKRPETTEKVFEAIRQAKPPKLLVVADGPRPDRPGEAEKSKDTREIINRVDWDCEVLTNYSDVNLGCKKRISSGIDWVFENVEEAIILEDDCIPHITFFQFCEEMLERYRYDERIMCISGLSVPNKVIRTEDSYHFSLYNRIWGWASWRRAWKYFDVEMKLWPKAQDENFLNYVLKDSRSVKFWTRIFQDTYQGNINSWGYAWTFSCWVQNGYSVLPCVNLVTNIGFGKDATHTTNSSNSPRAQLRLEEMHFPLQHPPFINRSIKAEQWIQNNIHSPNLFMRLKNKLWKMYKF